MKIFRAKLHRSKNLVVLAKDLGIEADELYKHIDKGGDWRDFEKGKKIVK